MLLLLGLTAQGAHAANTTFEECAKRIGSNVELSCSTLNAQGAISTELQEPGVALIPASDPELRCGFQFWTYNGQFFPADSLPAPITVADGEVGTAISWHFCSRGGGPCVGSHCSDFRTHVFGIDATNGSSLSEPFVEDVDPASAEGNCPTNAPCTTTTNVEVDALKAKSAVLALGFDIWVGHPADQRTIDPRGTEVAIYSSGESLPCKWGRELNFAGACVVAIDRLLWGEDIFNVVPLDPICTQVLNCPGCGPEGLCPNWEISLADVDMFVITLVDSRTGKIVAKAERLRDGTQVVRFTPSFNKGKPGSGYFLSFTPMEKVPAVPRRVQLKPRLDITRPR